MSFSRLVLVAGFALLAGCGVGGDFSDLRIYMDEVRAKPKGAIEPLPTFQPYESFTYRAASLRSPFQPRLKSMSSPDKKGRQRSSRMKAVSSNSSKGSA